LSKGKELSQFANKVEYDDGTNKIRVDAIQVPQNIFKTIAVAGQSNVEADTTSDTLTLVAGTNMTLTTDAGTDTITLASSGSGGTQNLFSTVAVAGQNDIVADSTTDTLTLAAGAGITLTTDQATDTLTITSSAGGGSLSNIVEDTSPQLGGTLDANSNTIDMGTNVLTDTNLGQFITAYGWGNHSSAGYLTSVPAQSFASLTGKPTTIAGYGITDAFDGAYGSLSGAPTMYANSDVDAHLNQSNPTSGYVLSWSGSDYAWVAQSGGGSALTVQEEGVSLATDADTLNFVGSNITATGTGGTKTITVAANAPGGSDTYVQFNDGGTLSGDAGMTYNKTTDVLTVGSITSTAAGTPTLTSSSAINLSVGSSVVIQQNSGGGGFRVGNLTTTNRNALTAANGEVIYNTTDNKFQVYENGAWANMIASSGISDVVSDTTPQLGGNLDVNGNDIVSASNGDIEIKPNGTGNVYMQFDDPNAGELIINKPPTTDTDTLLLEDCHQVWNTTATSNGTAVAIALHPGTDSGATQVQTFLRAVRGFSDRGTFEINLKKYNVHGYHKTVFYGGEQATTNHIDNGRVEFPGNVKLKSDGPAGTFASAKVGARNVFQITAPNQPNHYTFNDPDSHWFPTAEDDPGLTLRRGETYYFIIDASGHPLEIRDGNGGSAITQGITNNTTDSGTIIFKVPMNPTDLTLYYQCTAHSNMGAVINIV
tara:strand:- start:23292 stop:25418 length:2127 start_codon:yes stop_codon:yes gene_type:complete